MSYRVILADDEADVVEVIKQKVDWESLGYEEPLTASNGLEVMEKAESFKPDVVLTDIKMPFMDGLTLARNLKDLYPDIRIIIFSGFDEFDYAREAVHLEAEEYLLKPVNLTELTEIFDRIRKRLDAERDRRQNAEQLEAYYMQALPVLRENFLSSLVQGNVPASELEQYLQECRMELNGPLYCIVVFHVSSSLLPEGKSSVLANLSVRALAEEKFSYPLFNYLGNTVMLVETDSEDLVQLADACDKFCRLAESVCSVVVTAGIGSPVESLADVSLSYEGARTAVSYRVIYGRKKAISITEIDPAAGSDVMQEADLKDVFKRIKIDDGNSMESHVSKFLSARLKEVGSAQAYHLFVMDVVGELCRFARNNRLDMTEIFGRDEDIYNDIQHLPQDDLCNWMTGVCSKMEESLTEKRNDTTRTFVEKAKDYVAENYGNPDITIASVCEYLNVSSAYFSTVFKKETGKTFISYLTDYRMEKAVEMLIEGDEKTYVVASAVGYTDPNYFSYVFRRQFGMSPSKYKAQKK